MDGPNSFIDDEVPSKGVLDEALSCKNCTQEISSYKRGSRFHVGEVAYFASR